ncbi:MAG: benzoyl-CoA reductase subunit C [Planctomycetes bacterium]|nr:benzoyl-CoA reductase subunit C [Planctomycetota bacterium]
MEHACDCERGASGDSSCADSGSEVSEIVRRCEELYDDLDLGYVKKWKEEHRSKAIGFLPIYVPRELIHAAGMLPVGIMGAGDSLEIIRGDAYYQSYICHLPRSVIELGLSGRLDCIDGFLFPSICDVIRNLSGMWMSLFGGKYVKYLDLPQNLAPALGGKFYRHELTRIRADFERISGREITDDRLRKSIRTYNQNSRLVRDLFRIRSETPELAPASEVHLLMRAGNVLSVEDHSSLLMEYISATMKTKRKKMDNARIVLHGAFCEQPPLGLLRSLENAGCDIVDDDLVLVNRWIKDPVSTSGDPMDALVDAYLHHSVANASKYIADDEKGRELIETCRSKRVEGVIFAAPSFCDPSLLELPMLQDALDRAGIEHTNFRYSEDMGQFHSIREQAGTFADSIKLWS